MHFGVLGPLAVWTDEGSTVTVPGLKVRTLLACLLVRPGRPVPADRLIEDLWDPEPPANPIPALQAKVSQLRRVLADAESGGRKSVASTSAGYRVDVAPESVDAGRFNTLVSAARAQSDAGSRARALDEALALWRGPAFADFADQPFARAAIDELTEQWLSAVEDHAEARLALGEHHALTAELGGLLDEHPLRERLHAVQMQALYRCGRQAEALETYTRLRNRLVEGRGLDPGPELTQLQRAILSHDPQLDAEAASQRSEAGAPTNLPAPITTLIGREPAIARVTAILDTARLVTLTGPGGVGKTRLAWEVATRRTTSQPEPLSDGVWAVDLTDFDPSAHTDTVGSLADLVSSTLGIRDDATTTALGAGERATTLDRLAHALATRHLLLVLDNCEHAIEPAATLTESLLGSAPGLQVLATSRQPLGIAGETIWPVPPLVLPDPDVDHLDLDALSRSTAVQLFVARAAATTPSFELTADNGHAIASICQQLDGLPLALELAANRVRTLGVHDLAVRLEDRFRLLSIGHRNAPTRQQTLQAMIDWSWELLSKPERAVLRRLSVHAGGCTLDGAEAVCSDAGVDSAEVLDLLTRLVDRSLVAVDDTANGRRYRLLETVAAYCRERLTEAGETERVRLRHAHYYADLAERANSLLRGPDQSHWLNYLDAEAANLRTALTTTVQHPDAGLALRLAGATAWYWFLRGTYQEARRSLDLALSLPGHAPADARADAMAWWSMFGFLTGADPDPMQQSRSVLQLHDQIDNPAALARTRWLLGYAGYLAGQAGAEPLIDQALENFRRLDDRWGVAAALYAKADHALLRGDLDAAGDGAEEAALLFAGLGDRWGQVQTAKVLGFLAEIAGDHERSTQLHQEGFRKAEELGLWPTAAEQLSRLGRLALLAGDYRTADRYHHRARRLAHAHAHAGGVNFAHGGLGLTARRQGHFDLAESYLRPTLESERRIGYPAGQAWIAAQLGFTAEQRGDSNTAHTLHLEGLTAARASHDARAIALALEGLAGAQALEGHHDESAALLGAAEAHRNSVGSPLPEAERIDVDRITESIQTNLSDAEVTAAAERGRNTPLDQLLAAIANT